MEAIMLKRRADAVVQKNIAPGKKVNFMGTILGVVAITPYWLVQTADGSLLEPSEVTVIDQTVLCPAPMWLLSI